MIYAVIILYVLGAIQMGGLIVSKGHRSWWITTIMSSLWPLFVFVALLVSLKK